MLGEEKLPSEEKSSLESVYDCIKSYFHLLNQNILVPIVFLFNPKLISIMESWTFAVSSLNFLSDTAKSIYPNYNIGVISSFQPIELFKSDYTIGNCDPIVELEKFFTKWYLSNPVNRGSSAKETLIGIRGMVKQYIDRENVDITKAYSHLKTVYTQESKEEEEINDSCYPNLELILCIKFEDISKIDAIVEKLNRTLPNYLKSQDNNFDRYKGINSFESVIQSNLNILSVSMAHTLEENTWQLTNACDAYLYNVPEYLMIIFRTLTRIECRIAVDDRKYYINSQKPKTILGGGKSYYTCVDNFKKKAYYDRQYGKFNYILIEDSHVNNTESYVEIICTECKYIWKVRVSSHINNKCGCPRCSGNEKYTLSIAVKKAKPIHGSKNYDYSMNEDKDIISGQSILKFYHSSCGILSEKTTIHNHIIKKKGCTSCASRGSYTPEIVASKGIIIHNGLYDYTELLNSGMKIKNNRDNVPVYCKTCDETWHPTINDHINGRTGCPNCKNSKGEEAVKSYLTCQNLKPIQQFTLVHNTNARYDKKYDFYVKINNREYLIEFDGIQHFKINPRFNIDEYQLKINQQVDTQKTKEAIEHNHFLIRIDYTQINNIEYHIEQAIQASLDIRQKYYFSNPEMYKYITDNL